MAKSRGALVPVRRAVLRGLGLILPTLLTIVFILWVFGSVQRYVLSPIELLVGRVLFNQVQEVKFEIPPNPTKKEAELIKAQPNLWATAQQLEAKNYVRLASGEWVPRKYYAPVARKPGPIFPTTAEALYQRYVKVMWLTPQVTVTIFFCLLIIVCYLLGKLVAARVGAAVWGYFERIIDQVPFIRTVYGTVKQVTDIVFAESDMQFTRVVAVQYPRKGMWSVGFVTGESLLSIEDAAQEPVISVLMPTSPMPATGFTISVRKSEALELDLSVDQAFQFVVSCGVVSPGLTRRTSPEEIKATIEAQVGA
ncbi:MAG: DUF502 domain-containing protein [Planctomycetota bacterium]